MDVKTKNKTLGAMIYFVSVDFPVFLPVLLLFTYTVDAFSGPTRRTAHRI